MATQQSRRNRTFVGVVGTIDGIGYFRAWAAQIKTRVEVPPPGMTEKKDRLHLANFPGIEEAFGITFNENELVACAIDKKAIDATSRTINHHEAVSKVVQIMSAGSASTMRTKSALSMFDPTSRSWVIWSTTPPKTSSTTRLTFTGK